MAASRERWQLQDPGFGGCARGSSLGPLTPENSQKPRRRRAGNSEMRRRRRAALRFLVSFGGLGLTATRASSSRSAGTASVWSGQYGVSGLTRARTRPMHFFVFHRGTPRGFWAKSLQIYYTHDYPRQPCRRRGGGGGGRRAGARGGERALGVLEFVILHPWNHGGCGCEIKGKAMAGRIIASGRQGEWGSHPFERLGERLGA